MTWRDWLVFFFALCGFIVPLTFALRELLDPTDNQPLQIEASYAKDDRFFAQTFRKAMKALLSGETDAAGGGFSRAGIPLQTFQDLTVSDPRTNPAMLDIRGNLLVRERIQIDDEALIEQDCTLEDNVTVHLVACNGRANLKSGVTVKRWIDSLEQMTVGPGCTLGSRATSGEAIQVGADVSFRLLSAPRIQFGAGPRPAASSPRPSLLTKAGAAILPLSAIQTDPEPLVLSEKLSLFREALVLESGGSYDGDAVVYGDVFLRPGAFLNGSLKAHGSVWLEKGAIITESVVASQDVHVGEDASVGEHVVADRDITLSGRASVGREGRVTTVLAYHQITVSEGVIVYGRLLAMRGGRSA